MINVSIIYIYTNRHTHTHTHTPHLLIGHLGLAVQDCGGNVSVIKFVLLQPDYMQLPAYSNERGWHELTCIHIQT